MHEFRNWIDPDTLWKRHESPSSVWWFILMFPVFVLAIYRRSGLLGRDLLLSLAANLFVVSSPETDDAWATRVVRGERAWLEQGLLSSPRDLLFTVTGGLVNLYTIRAALHQRPVRTTAGTVTSMVFMLLFFARMAELYETTGTREAESETAH